MHKCFILLDYVNRHRSHLFEHTTASYTKPIYSYAIFVVEINRQIADRQRISVIYGKMYIRLYDVQNIHYFNCEHTFFKFFCDLKFNLSLISHQHLICIINRDSKIKTYDFSGIRRMPVKQNVMKVVHKIIKGLCQKGL